MSREIALAGLSVSLFLLLNRSKSNIRKRRWWRRQLFQSSNRPAHDLLDTLRLEDGMGFRNFVRMSPVDFEELLQMVGARISKQNSTFRESVSPSVRLAATLRYLASGDSFTSLMYTFKVSKQIISVFVPVVCEAIISVLKPYIKVSKNLLNAIKIMYLVILVCN